MFSSAKTDTRRESPRDREFESVLAECLERLEAEGMGVVAEFCAAHAHHASELRETIDRLHAAGILQCGADENGFPERLGEFRLKERIGSGGMGVVFRAEQENLGRQVAIKVIRPENLFFPHARDRLMREVEAVARLEHPGIISVHTFGEDRGVPFFAMEFVRGCSLADALDAVSGRNPDELTGRDLQRAVSERVAEDTSRSMPRLFDGTWNQCCARIIRQVAEAIQHAHERGIIHRDLKPSNIMLTPDGRALVVDFGLALLQESPKLTRTGSALGSLPYMAPEQVRGTHQDERIDVYALGVCLYEMLTVRPAFGGDDPMEIQAEILEGLVPPPRSIRSGLSRNLETVCLTALQRDRTRRYERAADLSADLSNVLEQRPIHARRPGWLARLRLWVQRHKAWSASIVLAALLLVGTPTTFLIQQRTANDKLASAMDLADANFKMSLEAVDGLLAEVSMHHLRHLPGMTEVQHRILLDTAGFYRRLLAKQPDNMEIQRRLVRTLSHLGVLCRRMERHEEAIAHMRSGIVVYGDAGPSSLGDGLHLKVMRANLALILCISGRRENALAEVRATLRELESPAGWDDVLADYHATRGSVCRILSTIHQRMGQQDAQIEAIETARTEFEAAVGLARKAGTLESREGRFYRQEFAKVLVEIALRLRRSMTPETREKVGEESMQTYETAIRIGRELAEEQPENPEYRASLAVALAGKSNLARDLDDREAAMKGLRRSIALWEKLAEQFAAIPEYRARLAGALNNLALLHYLSKDYAAVFAPLRRAIDIQHSVLASHPDTEESRAFLPRHYRMYITTLVRAGKFAEVPSAIEDYLAVEDGAKPRMLAAESSARCVVMAPDPATAREYSNAAFAHLEKALATERRYVVQLSKKGFAALRGDSRLQDLIARYR